MANGIPYEEIIILFYQELMATRFQVFVATQI